MSAKFKVAYLLLILLPLSYHAKSQDKTEEIKNPTYYYFSASSVRFNNNTLDQNFQNVILNYELGLALPSKPNYGQFTMGISRFSFDYDTSLITELSPIDSVRNQILGETEEEDYSFSRTQLKLGFMGNNQLSQQSSLMFRANLNVNFFRERILDFSKNRIGFDASVNYNHKLSKFVAFFIQGTYEYAPSGSDEYSSLEDWSNFQIGAGILVNTFHIEKAKILIDN